MLDTTAPYLAALVALGMGLSFLLADPRTRTSRALSIALFGAAGSIVCNVTWVAGHTAETLPPFASLLVLPEVIGFLAAYQFLWYLRQTIPAAELRTRFGDNTVRAAQLLVIVYGVESMLWPGLRAEFFQNSLAVSGSAQRLEFYAFALPLELSMLLAGLSAALLLNRDPDRAERARLVAICCAVPVMAMGLVLPPDLAPTITVVGEMILLIGAVRYHVFQGQRSQFLGRFLSPPVEAMVRRQGLRAMQQDTREVVVVACDLRGFTALAAHMPSEQTLHLLREFYDAVGTVTTRYGATIKDYAGDGVLILLGAPLDCADASRRGAALARELQQAVAPILARWARPEQPLGLGIGIATGPVTVGVIGGDRLEYVAVGRTVNLAARLCDHAESGETLIDSATATELEPEAASPRQATAFKGFAEPVSPFALAA